jgi:farnesol dehydrogenase
MRVLVTGGTGYLGQTVVRTLATRGHTPVVFARRATQAQLPGDAIDGDVRDRAALLAAARGCDAICHGAALVKIWRRDPTEFDAVNVGGLENAIAVVRELGLPRLVYTSSFLALPPAAEHEPIIANDYQRTKAAADAVAQRAAAEGVPIVSMYPGVIYGPGVRSEGNLLGRLLHDHAAGKLPGIVGADKIWCFSWVEDVAEAHVAALDRGTSGGRYTLGGENAPQMRPFEIAYAIKKWPLPRTIPYWAATALGAIEEVRARFGARAGDVQPLITRGTVDIFRFDWPLSSEEARRDLGYAESSLRQRLPGLLDAIDVERQSGHAETQSSQRRRED